jgi:hypothetical protein
LDGGCEGDTIMFYAVIRGDENFWVFRYIVLVVRSELRQFNVMKNQMEDGRNGNNVKFD